MPLLQQGSCKRCYFWRFCPPERYNINTQHSVLLPLYFTNSLRQTMTTTEYILQKLRMICLFTHHSLTQFCLAFMHGTRQQVNVVSNNVHTSLLAYYCITTNGAIFKYAGELTASSTKFLLSVLQSILHWPTPRYIIARALRRVLAKRSVLITAGCAVVAAQY